jgi:hypothetical protein
MAWVGLVRDFPANRAGPATIRSDWRSEGRKMEHHEGGS